ncbi:hypothetical protein KI688_005688 [Linnemannia hyalina]|uniref:Uncharacterized protein n=1 Tax=Linnemannia hyalina TaxID=64524 RepID=A0A9P7Y538_9FUNG|nr:hypothetical protein KI688_005688 [Linnemannia hyalina]
MASIRYQNSTTEEYQVGEAAAWTTTAGGGAAAAVKTFEVVLVPVMVTADAKIGVEATVGTIGWLALEVLDIGMETGTGPGMADVGLETLDMTLCMEEEEEEEEVVGFLLVVIRSGNIPVAPGLGGLSNWLRCSSWQVLPLYKSLLEP